MLCGACKRSQQLSTLGQHCWRSFKEAMHSGTVILPFILCKLCNALAQTFSRGQRCCGSMQTGATCCATLHRSQKIRNVGTCCAKSSTGFKLYATSANSVVAPCKRTQHVGPNNVACCWPTMLRPFVWAFSVTNTKGYSSSLTRACRHLVNV